MKTSKSVDKGAIALSEISGEYQFIGRTSVNNGVQGYVDYLGFEPNAKNTFSVIQIGENIAQFRNKEWYASQNIFILSPLATGIVENYNFFISSINTALKRYDGGYSNYPTLDKLKQEKISLPTQNGKIDFSFMENFISQLETFRLSQLEAYLLVTGLKDYTLNNEENQALTDFCSGKVRWENIKVVDIFNVKNTRNILSRDVKENSGDIPYLSASRENNAVSSYITYNEDYLDKGNCIFIGGKTFVVTYQEKDFYSNDSHNLALYLKDEKQKNKLNQLFLTTCIYKGLDYKYSWGDSISNRKIQSDVMKIPMKDTKPDYDYMALLISAVQKLVIKDVVLYADRKIAATRQVVERD